MDAEKAYGIYLRCDVGISLKPWWGHTDVSNISCRNVVVIVVKSVHYMDVQQSRNGKMDFGFECESHTTRRWLDEGDCAFSSAILRTHYQRIPKCAE